MDIGWRDLLRIGNLAPSPFVAFALSQLLGFGLFSRRKRKPNPKKVLPIRHHFFKPLPLSCLRVKMLHFLFFGIELPPKIPSGLKCRTQCGYGRLVQVPCPAAVHTCGRLCKVLAVSSFAILPRA